jgi:hypothetical protein
LNELVAMVTVIESREVIKHRRLAAERAKLSCWRLQYDLSLCRRESFLRQSQGLSLNGYSKCLAQPLAAWAQCACVEGDLPNQFCCIEAVLVENTPHSITLTPTPRSEPKFFRAVHQPTMIMSYLQLHQRRFSANRFTACNTFSYFSC